MTRLRRKFIKDTSLHVSQGQFRVFIKEFNKFEMPLKERAEKLTSDSKMYEKFCDFVMDRTDIPIAI